jgi:hypothetical protein
MLRAFLRALFGRPEPTTAPARPETSSAWRTAPTKTWSDDVGEGISVTMTVTTGHHGFLSVVGESRYQETLRSRADQLGPDGVFTARLVPEPDNPYDANAVAVCVDGSLAKVGYLARQVAKTYHPRLAGHGAPATCPARLTGVGAGTIGVVLDFEEVREVLGLSRVSVDQGDMDYEAVAEYHRLNDANRLFVKETRSLERSNLADAITRYRRAVAVLGECRDFAQAKELVLYGFTMNQTDAIPIERLTRCLLKIGKVNEAAMELDRFIEAFPHAGDMTLLKSARARIDMTLAARKSSTHHN